MITGTGLIALSALNARSPWLVSPPSIVIPASPLHDVLGSVSQHWPPMLIALTALTGTGLLGAGFVLALGQAQRGAIALPPVLWLALFTNLVAALLPPISSADIFSYLTQGRLLALGENPYVATAADFPSEPVARLVDPMWRAVPSPYGPLFLVVAQLVSRLGSLAHQILGMKLLVLAAALGATGLAVLSASRTDPTRRTVAGVLTGLNPLVILSVVGAGRNDSFVMFMIAIAMALWTAKPLAWLRPGLSLASIVAAGLVKPPAVLIAAPLAVVARMRTRIRSPWIGFLVVWGPAGSLVFLVSRPFLSELPSSIANLSMFSTYWNFLSPSALPVALATRLGLYPASDVVAMVLAGYAYLLPLLSLSGIAVLVLRERTRHDLDPIASLEAGSVILFLSALSLPSFSHWYLAWLAPLTWCAPRTVRQPFVLTCAVAPFLDAVSRPEGYVFLYVGLRDAALLALVPFLLLSWFHCFQRQILKPSSSMP